MSGYLARMAARAVAGQGTAAPRLPSRFEPSTWLPSEQVDGSGVTLPAVGRRRYRRSGEPRGRVRSISTLEAQRDRAVRRKRRLGRATGLAGRTKSAPVGCRNRSRPPAATSVRRMNDLVGSMARGPTCNQHSCPISTRSGGRRRSWRTARSPFHTRLASSERFHPVVSTGCQRAASLRRPSRSSPSRSGGSTSARRLLRRRPYPLL